MRKRGPLAFVSKGYEVRWLALDPGPEYFGSTRKRKVYVPQPQTEAQRIASEADDLLWEEVLARTGGLR